MARFPLNVFVFQVVDWQGRSLMLVLACFSLCLCCFSVDVKALLLGDWWKLEVMAVFFGFKLSIIHVLFTGYLPTYVTHRGKLLIRESWNTTTSLSMIIPCIVGHATAGLKTRCVPDQMRLEQQFTSGRPERQARETRLLLCTQTAVVARTVTSIWLPWCSIFYSTHPSIKSHTKWVEYCHSLTQMKLKLTFCELVLYYKRMPHFQILWLRCVFLLQFYVSGQSFQDSDSVHGNIEREFKRRLTPTSRIHTPSTAMEIIRNSSSNGYEVIELAADSMHDWKDVHRKLMGQGAFCLWCKFEPSPLLRCVT